MPILPRYALAEVVKVFLVAMAALTLILVIVGLVREGQQQGLPLAQIVALVPYVLIDSLRFTIPMTLLLACTTAFSRMSGANEVVAIKALGISPLVLLWPVLVLAFLLSLLTVWLNDLAPTWGRSNIQRVVIEEAEEIIFGLLQSQHRYCSPMFSINVKRVEGHKLLRPTLTIQGSGTCPTTTITAEWAGLQSDRLRGVLKFILHDCTVEMGEKIYAQFPVYELEIPLDDASRSHSSGAAPTAFPMRLIPAEVARQRAAIELSAESMAARAACQMICGEFDDLAGGQWPAAEAGQADLFSRLYRLLTEPQRRWSAGFSCFCFAWIGIPMAIRLRNRDFLTSFFLCFSPILVVYYPLLIYGLDGAKNGTIPPIAVWAGNGLLLIWGAWLLRRVMRY